MYGREELKTYISCELYDKSSDEFKVGEAFLKEEADSVMDAMEARVKELEAAISILETTQKWISVEDRLPPKGQHVLVVRNHRSLYPIDVVCWSEDYITHDIVTHWQPLPPPPTTEESSAIEKEI